MTTPPPSLRRRRLTAVSLFSGIGGIDLGLERAGFHVAAQCEIDKDARRVLAEHWPSTPCHTDVRELQRDDLPATVDVLAGGFPCQDVSVAGRRAGLAGERSGLFHEFVRVAVAVTPPWLLIENVPGLLSSGHLSDCANPKCGSCNPGADMATVLGTLADLGYWWSYRVLDAQYFGVPQRRRRVFIVGHLGNVTRAGSVLFESEGGYGNSPTSREARNGVPNGTSAGAAGRSIARSLNAHAGRLDGESETFLPVALHMKQDPINGEVSPALGGTSAGMAVAFTENQLGDVWESPVTGAVQTSGGKPGQGYQAIRQGQAVRRLTPLECERLQGFPDGWTSCLADSARYRTLGNAVAVPVAEWIARRMIRLTS